MMLLKRYLERSDHYYTLDLVRIRLQSGVLSAFLAVTSEIESDQCFQDRPVIEQWGYSRRSFKSARQVIGSDDALGRLFKERRV